MTAAESGRILTLNCGSSSIKVAVFLAGDGERRLLRGLLEGITLPSGRVGLVDEAGHKVIDQERPLPDHATALQFLFEQLATLGAGDGLRAVGHRVVHGGPHYRNHARVTPEMIKELRRIAPFDPLHLPAEVDAIEAVAELFPALPQVACFDTAFHRTIPDVAKLFPLPRSYGEEGIHRYGFHGLSYEFISQELARTPGAATGRVIVAHLGSGASMAAVRDGRGIDTTMGFSPTGGLMMGTRCGDLDPGLMLYLMMAKGMSASEVNRLFNHQSGLRGVSGTSSDMRDLLDVRSHDPAADLAITMFCYHARKWIGAYAAALGGLDTLIFTAGIGERSAPVRAEICAGLEFLGVRIDAERNRANTQVISAENSPVAVRVVPTDEERMIVRHTHREVFGS